jgi:ubiquinone/menaquinone biosynthesis C-methylase UbiE
MSEVQRHFSYSNESAASYSTLGISGTTYELGFRQVAKFLGRCDGKSLLDFGCGTGRSTRFLQALHPRYILGVDHNKEMLVQARKVSTIAKFQLIGRRIPTRNDVFDAAISCSVFVEMRTKSEMFAACREIFRVLKPNSPLVIMSTNPAAFAASFHNFSYSAPSTVSSGDVVTCVVHSDDRSFEILDTYWALLDYRIALRTAGFRLRDIAFPRANQSPGLNTDESRVAPFAVMRAWKPSRSVRP